MSTLDIIQLVCAGLFCACVGALFVADVSVAARRSSALTITFALIAAIGAGSLGTCVQAGAMEYRQ